MQSFEVWKLVSAEPGVDYHLIGGVLLVQYPAVGSEEALDAAVRLAARDSQDKLAAFVFGRDRVAEAVEPEARLGRYAHSVGEERLQRFEMADLPDDVGFVENFQDGLFLTAVDDAPEENIHEIRHDRDHEDPDDGHGRGEGRAEPDMRQGTGINDELYGSE